MKRGTHTEGIVNIVVSIRGTVRVQNVRIVVIAIVAGTQPSSYELPPQKTGYIAYFSDISLWYSGLFCATRYGLLRFARNDRKVQ